MKNHLGNTLALALWVVVMCAGLSLLPAGMVMGPFELRKMDIFGAIRPEKKALQPQETTWFPPADTTAALPAPAGETDTFPLGPMPPLDSLLYGRVIEDYTPDQSGLSGFFAAVAAIPAKGNTVRIAFYGDSFVEGDIVIGDLRDTLQQLWGGNGVGFLPITSEVARFKRTVQHEYANWRTYSIVKNHDMRLPFGINGYIYYPEPNARVRYKATSAFAHTRGWTKARLFYSATHPAELLVRLNNGAPESRLLPPSEGLATSEFKNPGTSAIEFSIPVPPEDLTFYGIALESGPGVYIDNFSVRGNTGGRLRLLKPELVHQFDAVQHYDLVVVQLGLNAVTPSLDNIKWYRHELDLTFKHLRKCFPRQPILVVSVADRGGKVGDELATMPAVPAIAGMQRELARQHGFLFYDLYRGMGGPGAMIDFSNRRPALANKDFTHLTHQGGHVIGQLFARLLLGEKTRYSGF